MGAIHEHCYNPEEAIQDPLQEALNALTEMQEESAHSDHIHDHVGEIGEIREIEEILETLTAFMLGLKSRSDILMMQRRLNTFEEEALTAIMPAVTLLELWSVVGPMEKALLIISILVLIVAFAGMLTTIMTSLNERRREMAILRSVGARPRHIFRLIVQEAIGVTLGGILIGATLVQLLIIMFSPAISSRFGIFMKPGWFSLTELAMMGIILLGGMLMGILPAYRSYRNSLADGLTIKT
jgi:putative ABC transport system permease protein